MWTTPSLSGNMGEHNWMLSCTIWTACARRAMEAKEENQLLFLDVLVQRNGDSLTTTVYHKKTHTDWYLHFWSHHHPQAKTSVVYCLKMRAERVCTGDDFTKELHHLPNVFWANRYACVVTQQETYIPLHTHRRHWTEDADAVLLQRTKWNDLLGMPTLEYQDCFRSASTLRSLFTHIYTPTSPEE